MVKCFLLFDKRFGDNRKTGKENPVNRINSRTLTIVGAIVVLVAFFLPWTSVATLSLNGWGLAFSNTRPDIAGMGMATWYLLLLAVPVHAAVVLWLVLKAGSVTTQKEATNNAAWQAVSGIIGAGIVVLVFLDLTIRVGNPYTSGLLAYATRTEYGLLLTLLGFAVMIAGPITDLKQARQT